jgi:hypothetical protein
MLTKKSLLTSLKGKSISLHLDHRYSHIDISPATIHQGVSYGTHTITQIGEDIFEAKTKLGGKEYFSIAHVRKIEL